MDIEDYGKGLLGDALLSVFKFASEFWVDVVDVEYGLAVVTVLAYVWLAVSGAVTRTISGTVDIRHYVCRLE